MAPTFLIAGATGNTGVGVIEALPKLVQESKSFSGYRILALTRSLDNPVVKQNQASIEWKQQNWVEITADWLRQHEVVRVFIASHNNPNQFAEESQFYINALQAGVKYVVRISTTAANVRPDCPAYYPRSHWAIEQMLSQPEFRNMHWSSLQPNLFFAFAGLDSAAEFIKQYRKTKKQTTLMLFPDGDALAGVIDAAEVGVFAAHLLTSDNTTQHNQARYVLNGPEDINGQTIVKLVEQHIGTKVDKVTFNDVSFLDKQAETTAESKNLILSIKQAMNTTKEGKCKASTTSKEVLSIAAPKNTAAKVLADMLKE